MTRSSKVLSRIAALGLAIFLVVLSGFTIWAGQSTQQTGMDARQASLSSGLYGQIRAGLATEASAQHEYWAIRDASLLKEFDRANRLMSAALLELARNGDPQDRAVADQISLLQREYTRRSRQFFNALRQGNETVATSMDAQHIEPMLQQMSHMVDQASLVEGRQATNSFTALDRQSLFVRVGSVVIFLLGLALLGFVWSILRFYRRRIEETQEAERVLLERAAVTDSITGLGNHRAFQETLRREVSRSLRHDQILSLAIVDIDDFKLLNDQHGHSHGDRVLTHLATCFSAHRIEDQPFRLGGDEFAVILPSVDAGAAHASMDRLRGRAELTLFGATVSIGIAQLDPTEDDAEMDAETLREMADAALYEAKRRGRNTVVTFEEIKTSASIVSTRHVNAVRRLLAERDFSVAYQPIWDIERRVLLGYEALMRPAEQYGLSGPQNTFDIAEKLGRASELDELCRDRILAESPPLPRGAFLFINVSPASLDHVRFSDDALLAAVSAAHLQPSCIVFEITEHAVARADMVVREAKRLRALGFRLALDDVGAGNAGLEVLRHVPVDFVKIDRSVVAEALVDASAAAVMAGIVAFARKSNTFVIAEGIETTAMLDMVHSVARPSPSGEQAIQGAQGYLLGKPSRHPLEPEKSQTRIPPQSEGAIQPESRVG